MWYLIFWGILTAWVLVDALKRKANAVPWAVGTVLLGPIILPFYFAKRPLKSGEIREGGTAWNVLKNFAIFWTLLMAVAAIWSMVAISEHSSILQSEAEKTGAAIGTALGLGMIVFIWFFPFIGAFVLGLILKKSSIVERGPTGPLATASVQDEPSSISPKKTIGWDRWIGIGLVGLLIVVIIGSFLTKRYHMKKELYNAKASFTEKQIRLLGQALDGFKLDTGRYPNTAEGLDALVANPGIPNWDGPYLKKAVPNDIWGNPYIYTSLGSHGDYDLYSYGADGSPFGEGENKDIVSWE